MRNRSHLSKWPYQKTLHCLKNVKTIRELRERERESNIDQTVLVSKLFGSSLIFSGETGAGGFWPAALLCCRRRRGNQKQRDAPIPVVNFQVYF